MIRKMAQGLADAFGGETYLSPSNPDPGGDGWLVVIPRPDGKVALVDRALGLVYANRRDFDRARVLADLWPEGGDRIDYIDSAIWNHWDNNQWWAEGFAKVVGGKAWHSGGNNLLVLCDHPNGNTLVVGPEGVGLYSDDEFQPEHEVFYHNFT